MVYSECVSNCPKTCKNPYINSENKQCLRRCWPGCVCAEGTVMDEGRNGVCVPLEDCTCRHRGKTFMSGEVLQRRSQRWYVQFINQ
ncbi:MAG: trypsin inhibitor-like cysteine-rich domain-containing protein [Bacteroidia bacterium]|nr:trypsin inhibitor-like cysteine-rich domain-containing protein [Bacteroidia bacterium]